jgi:hypothetical protein
MDGVVVGARLNRPGVPPEWLLPDIRPCRQERKVARKPPDFPLAITAKDFRGPRRPENNGDAGAAIKRV